VSRSAKAEHRQGFLVLSRKPSELIRVVVHPSTKPQTLWVRLESTNNFRARIGLQADPEIEIVRAELTDEQPTPPIVADAATAI